MRVVQISDTHLSRSKPHFADNWPPLADWISVQRPDLVIHTGDVTVDGAEVEDDLAYCAQLMNGIGSRWRAVPGNHDVGDANTHGNRSTPRGWRFGDDISGPTGGSRTSVREREAGD